jgi:lipopolysaccharide/colanic/teichoic acid biosynthesis glycosyltransferase
MELRVKRSFDILFATLGIIILSPVFAWLSLSIRMQDPGPVFYRAPRVGKGKKQFFIFKFRSMVMNADKVGGPTTSSNDPRVTDIGHTIRKYKLDELAQLLNVVLGHMSLVGPRPEIPSEVKLYGEDCDIIFSVRPGITDYASIEFRDEGGIIERSGIADPHEAYRQLIQPKKIELQKRYVRDRSFMLDIKLIFKTLLAIIK